MIEKYYKQRDNTLYTKLTKEQIKEKVDPFRESTFLLFLKEMDYPYFSDEWLKILKVCIEYNRKDLCFGRYISKMWLSSFKGYHWEDSNLLNSIQYKECQM